jgi:hypothetical protein
MYLFSTVDRKSNIVTIKAIIFSLTLFSCASSKSFDPHYLPSKDPIANEIACEYIKLHEKKAAAVKDRNKIPFAVAYLATIVTIMIILYEHP